MKKNKFVVLVVIVLAIILVQPRVFNRVISTFGSTDIKSQLGIEKHEDKQNRTTDEAIVSELKNTTFDGTHQVVEVNQNQPTFTSQELSLDKGSWQKYSELDLLNRVGQANAMLGIDIMPTTQRESIADIKPTGWHNKKIIFNGQQDYLYNRCHLIGFQLSGQNANANNLMTGTRSLNANFENEKESMVYYENLVADYIRQTEHHVRYQVTPIFKGVELVARGIRMQAQSIEDDQIKFDVYVFNVQKGYEIDYLTGLSKEDKIR